MAEKTAEQAPERAALKWIGGAVVGLILGGTALYYLARPDDAPTQEESAAATATATVEVTEPEAEAQSEAPAIGAVEPAPAEEPASPSEHVAPPEPVVPSFDTVRVDADGSVLVAGRAAAGTAVSILVDEAETATAEADGKGTFAALFTLEPSAAPRVMTLRVTAADGSLVLSEDSVVIGPIASPELVADAERAPAPEATAPETGPEDVAAAAEDPDAEEAAPEMAAEAVAGQAPAAPEVLIIDSDGVRRQTEAGSVADIVIDTIGYGPTGDVEIAGRGTAGQFARIYLDNSDTAAVGIGADGGWAAVLTDVAPGRYTLRVDQMDSTGEVTSRFETPFQREAPETVVATLQPKQDETAPADTGAVGQTLPETATESTAAPETPETSVPEATEAPEPDTAPAAGTGDAPRVVTDDDTATAIAAAPAAETAPKPATRAAIVTVQPGFTLWRIARENYGEGFLYVKVYEANKDQIRDPDLIYPGQLFKVPDPTE